MGQRLNLTDDQKAQILPIITDRQQKMQELRSQNSGNRRAMHKQMRTIRHDSDKKIEAILTDQQRKQYAEMKKQMRDRAKQRRNRGGQPS